MSVSSLDEPAKTTRPLTSTTLRSADGEHLLLAAGELGAAVVDALAQPREGRHDALEVPFLAAIHAGARGHDQVLAHRQVGEDAAPFRHVGDAGAGDGVRRGLRHVAATHLDAALAWPHQAEHGFQQRGLAHAVAAHQADGLAAMHGEVDAMQDVADAVEAVQAVGFQ